MSIIIKTVYGTSTIRNILYIEPSPVQLQIVCYVLFRLLKLSVSPPCLFVSMSEEAIVVFDQLLLYFYLGKSHGESKRGYTQYTLHRESSSGNNCIQSTIPQDGIGFRVRSSVWRARRG